MSGGAPEIRAAGAPPCPLRPYRIVLLAADAARAEPWHAVLAGGDWSVRTATAIDADVAEADVVVLDGEMIIEDQPALAALRAVEATRRLPVLHVGAPVGAGPGGPLQPGRDDWIEPPVDGDALQYRVSAMLLGQRRTSELHESRSMRGEQMRMWSLLLDLSRSVASLSDFDALMRRVVTTASALTRRSRVALLLPEPDGRAMAVAAAEGLDPVFARAWRRPIAENGDACPLSDDIMRPAVRPSLVLPLRTARRAVGEIDIWRDDDAFEPWEREVLDLLANIAGSAIDDHLLCHARNEARDSIVVALATLAEYRDNETGRHVDRVTRFSVMLAEELRAMHHYVEEIDDDFVLDLRRAAPLHDIGKVAVPDAILLKPGALTPDEIEVIRTHAPIGRDAIRAVRRRSPGVSFLRMAEEIAGSHHEWWDGCGYPDGISGEVIPLCARIVAIADVYDALTSKRVYKDAMPHEVAASIIVESSGKQFDPAIVEAFLRRQNDFAALARELADELPEEAAPATPGAREAA